MLMALTTAHRTVVRRSAKAESADLDVHPVLRNVYRNRNVCHAGELDYSLANLLPPSQLSNIDEASEIIVEAIQANASILIAGDFDADGATGTALGYLALTAFGARKVQYLCPDRHEFGYGLSEKFVDFFAPVQPDLVITVDNGITSVDGVRRAKEYGMSVIVTDHHLPGEELPEADAIVNPRLPGDRFESKNLAGVGVMFYVMATVRSRLKEDGWFENEGIAEPNMSEFLDLVALGTVADLVPLDYNNRILVAQGLKRINAKRCRYGVQCLLEEGGRRIGEIVAEDLAFAAGPRLNAAGRLDDIGQGIKCLVSGDKAEVLDLIQSLEKLNDTRKEMETDMMQSVMREIASVQVPIASESAGVCLYNSSWHQGVIGLIASRIKELTGKPTVIFTSANDGYLRGSGRSVKRLNLRDVLADIAAIEPGIFKQYGGHAMAAGMTLKESDYERFQSLYQTELAQKLGDGAWDNQVLSDGEIAHYDLEAAEQIRQGGPWGQEFEAPVFDGVFEIVSYRLLKEEHLKLTLKSSRTGTRIDGIYFRYWTYHDDLPGYQDYRFAFQLSVNDYMGRRSPQLIVVHMEERNARPTEL